MKFQRESLSYALFFALALTACKPHSKDHDSIPYSQYIDTAVAVYGAYDPVVLPVSKGVKIVNPIQIGLGPDGYIYAANQSGEVYTLRDSDHDGLEDSAVLYCDINKYGLRSPSSFVFRDNQLFLGTSQQIRVFEDLTGDGVADTTWVFFDQFPNSKHPYEWTTGLNFGADGYLYFALSSDSWNVAPSPDPLGFRGALLRVSPDGKKAERLAVGLRSPYGVAFNERGDLFFIDNEGGDNPTEELNRWTSDAFFGHNPKKYNTYPAVVPPEHRLMSDVAPAGIAFNSTTNDFGGTAGDLFVAYYGPGEKWDRGSIARVKITARDSGQIHRYRYEEAVVADIPKVSDLAFGRDGNLYVAQNGRATYWYEPIPHEKDQGRFYKLIYNPQAKHKLSSERKFAQPSHLSEDAVKLGRELFARRACLGCHERDGKTELLGPNLKYVGDRLTRREILEAIEDPSKIIKPSMMAMKVNKKDGQTLVGRVVSADDQKIYLMLVGNTTVEIARLDIRSTENVAQSLMPPGLIKPLTSVEIDALLDYLISLKDQNNKF